MTKQELQEEFDKLKSLARQVSDANENYKPGLLADLGAEEEDGEDVRLDLWQLVDLKNTEECGKRLDYFQKAVQEPVEVSSHCRNRGLGLVEMGQYRGSLVEDAVCGSCQPGDKEMTLSEERELEVIKESSHTKADAHRASMGHTVPLVRGPNFLTQ